MPYSRVNLVVKLGSRRRTGRPGRSAVGAQAGGRSQLASGLCRGSVRERLVPRYAVAVTGAAASVMIRASPSEYMCFAPSRLADPAARTRSRRPLIS